MAKRATTATHFISVQSACLDDAELLRRLARNVDGAFEPLVLAWQDRLYVLALRLSGNAQDAEEIAQDTFVRAYRALGEYAPERILALRLRPWLYQIAVNLWRNRHRRHQLPTRSLDLRPTATSEGYSPAPSLAEILADADPQIQPETVLERAEMQRLLAQHLTALEPHLRLAVTLRHVEGMSYPEIAALLEQPVGTVKSHAHRGAAQLRAALAHEPAYQPDEVYV